MTAERRLPLQGPDNFRDLGGYEGWQGRPVRWGRLYRSNELAELTTSDLGYLSRLDVKLVCDFRSDGERKEKPNPALFSSEEAGYWPAPVEQEGADGTTMRYQVRTGGITADWIHGVMLVAYRAFVTDHSPTWAAMFQRIARPENLPTVLHCTAGKDRTGFASALILFSLGVSEETVFEDYLATNHYRADFAAFVLRWIRLYSFFRTNPESLIPLLEARREYLQASIDEMNERYGSVDGYLRDGLGVTDELRASLRKNLLR